jgi:hypothetical protein
MQAVSEKRKARMEAGKLSLGFIGYHQAFGTRENTAAMPIKISSGVGAMLVLLFLLSVVFWRIKAETRVWRC